MAHPDRALAVDAGLTGVLGVVFLASTATATRGRSTGWALLAANVLPLLALRRAPPRSRPEVSWSPAWWPCRSL